MFKRPRSEGMYDGRCAAVNPPQGLVNLSSRSFCVVLSKRQNVLDLRTDARPIIQDSENKN
jgi:hypothetical protein